MPLHANFRLTIRSGLGGFLMDLGEWCGWLLAHCCSTCACIHSKMHWQRQALHFVYMCIIQIRASKPQNLKTLGHPSRFPFANRPSDNIPPPPDTPSILQLHNPPQTFLRLLHLPALLVRPGKRKPRLAVVPSRSALGQCG